MGTAVLSIVVDVSGAQNFISEYVPERMSCPLGSRHLPTVADRHDRRSFWTTNKQPESIRVLPSAPYSIIHCPRVGTANAQLLDQLVRHRIERVQPKVCRLEVSSAQGKVRVYEDKQWVPSVKPVSIANGFVCANESTTLQPFDLASSLASRFQYSRRGPVRQSRR